MNFTDGQVKSIAYLYHQKVLCIRYYFYKLSEYWEIFMSAERRLICEKQDHEL